LKRRREEQRYAWTLISPAMVVVFGVIIAPLFATLVYSLVHSDLMSSQYGEFAGLHFYLSALSSREFWADLWRTLDFTVVSIVLEITFGLLIALLLNERFPGVRFLRSIIIIPWALPTVVSGSLWKLIFHGEYGVLNEILLRLKLIPNFRSWLGNPVTAMRTIIIADVWKMAPLSVIFFLAALQSSNKDIHEAAMVDGANVFQRFFKLTLPDLMPTIIIVAVMRTVDKFKSFDLFYLMTRGGPSNATRTLMYDAYLKAFKHLNFSQAATYSYLIALFVALMTLAYVKMMRRGRETI
jgi:ABC-type sugar transport system permease subunit